MRNDTELKLRVPKALLASVEEAAQGQNISVSEVTRSALQAYLASIPVTSSLGDADGAFLDAPLEERLRSSRVRMSIGELYSGPGGLAVGAELAGFSLENRTYEFTHKWASDYDADTCQTYSQNIRKFSPECQVICADVRALSVDKLTPVDGLLFGFPCNDFSIVGESKGLSGNFGPLYKYGVDYLKVHQPAFFLAENVSGLSSANEGDAFQKILGDLEAAGSNGYRLTVNLYKFEEYGVPQARHRIIVIGIRRDLRLEFRVPKPSGRKVSSREAIETPKIPTNAPNNELTAQSKIVEERLSHIKPGQNAWNADLPEHLRLNVKGAKLSHIYKRLDPTKPSYTITGSGGGGTHVYHWKENRALTNRERARLQTFPDDFEFFGSKESVRKQIGMAVPPKGVSVILQSVLKTFAGIPYESVEPSIGYRG